MPPIDTGLISQLANAFFSAAPFPDAGVPSLPSTPPGPPSLPLSVPIAPPSGTPSLAPAPMVNRAPVAPLAAAPQGLPDAYAAQPNGFVSQPDPYLSQSSVAPTLPNLGLVQHGLPGFAALVRPEIAAPTGYQPGPDLTTGLPSAGSFYFLDGLRGPPAAPQSAPALPAAAPALPAQAPNPASVPSIPGLSLELRPELVSALGQGGGVFDPHAIKRDFPILSETVHGRPLIWLDNAATTQKPQAVIDRLAYFYEHENSNIHRAAHALAARATDAYEAARDKVRRFLGAASPDEIIFVRGATEGINLIAKSWGQRNIGRDDEIVISWLEHHANIVPWQQLCQETGARLKVAPVDDTGQIILEAYEKLLTPRTRLVAVSQVSNALGTITPVREMIEIAHRHGALVLVDGAQAISHMSVDVQSLDCDFYVFSGHKVFGPTGIGAVYGKRDVLEAMPPWQGGGNMIADVTFEKTLYHGAPARFEAGTGNIADAVGLGAAIDYVSKIGMPAISRYEHSLLVYGTEKLQTVPGLRLIGTAAEKASVLSFVMDGFKTETVGAALDREGIAVRSGHHCAQPILRRFGVEATVRPSLAFYNTCEDIDALVTALLRLRA